MLTPKEPLEFGSFSHSSIGTLTFEKGKIHKILIRRLVNCQEKLNKRLEKYTPETSEDHWHGIEPAKLLSHLKEELQEFSIEVENLLSKSVEGWKREEVNRLMDECSDVCNMAAILEDRLLSLYLKELKEPH